MPGKVAEFKRLLPAKLIMMGGFFLLTPPNHDGNYYHCQHAQVPGNALAEIVTFKPDAVDYPEFYPHRLHAGDKVTGFRR